MTEFLEIEPPIPIKMEFQNNVLKEACQALVALKGRNICGAKE